MVRMEKLEDLVVWRGDLGRVGRESGGRGSLGAMVESWWWVGWSLMICGMDVRRGGVRLRRDRQPSDLGIENEGITAGRRRMRLNMRRATFKGLYLSGGVVSP